MKLLLLVIALVGIASAKILTPSDQSRIIPGKYIIRLKDGVDAQKFIRSTSLRKQDGTLSALNDNTGYVYSNVFSGFSASLDETELKELDKSPEVMYIEPDGIATVQGQEQAGATWGLARSSSRTALSGSSYTYLFKSSAGNGVTAYVIDTGVNIAHTEFAGRAAYGYNAITGETDADGNGHGTHVAGTIGGSVYGIAKRSNIVSVKVLSSGGSGSWAGVTAGIDWVTANARPANRAVINMSLGGGATQSVDDAVAAAVRAGVTSVVAAGNSNANACNYSPARVPSAITVAASDINDRSASFTNYGSCTDLYAAGVSITSAWIGSNTATNTISGTSMASPHVAGVVALIISQYQTNSPAEVEAQLKAYATSNAISGVPTSDTPNVLVYNGGN